MKGLAPAVLALVASACGTRGVVSDSGGASVSESVASVDAATSNPVTTADPSDDWTATDPDADSGCQAQCSEIGGPGPGFVPLDYGDYCGDPCEFFGPATCSEGQKCAATACSEDAADWEISVCVDIVGTGAPGDPCERFDHYWSGVDTCDLGSSCSAVNPQTLTGTCFENCTGSTAEPLCPAGYRCAIPAQVVPALCVPWCDPLSQDCADPGEACVPRFDPDELVCLPSQAMDAPRGTPCVAKYACDPGLLCVDAGLVDAPGCDTQGCCSPMCDSEAMDSCAAFGEACVSLGIENSSVGACMIPEGP